MNYNQNSSTPIVPNQGRSNDYSTNNEVGTKPTGDPKSPKDFKKVLAKTKDGSQKQGGSGRISKEEEEENAEIATEGSIDKKSAPMTLFDLTSGKKPSTVSATPLVADDGSKIDKSMSRKGEASLGSLFSMKKDEKFTTRFNTEQPDLSYVNPLAAITNQPIEGMQIKTEKPAAPVANVQAIIDQLVEKVVEMKDAGRTDTVITLKNPPLFAGASIVVTAFDSAKGEFNLSFENLTQQAKSLLDLQSNRDSLIQALDQKGYGVHIVTTTTLIENRAIFTDAQQAQQERERQNPDQQRRQRQQQQDDQA